MSGSNRPLKVFLCYAHSDKELVHKLYNRITKKAETEAWLDIEKLQPGQNWEYEIRKAILKSDVVIVCLSRAFNKQHGYRHEELKIALKKAHILSNDIFIIPVRLEECDMPESLHHLHRVDLFKAGGYGRLLRALQGQVKLK